MATRKYDLRAPKQIRPGLSAREVAAEQPYDLRAPRQVRPGLAARTAAARAATIADRRNYIPGEMPSKLGLSGKKPPSGGGKVVTSQAPLASVPDTGEARAKLIGDYNLARADILKGMAPDIAGIYNDSNTRLQGLVGDSTIASHDSLFGMGGGNQPPPVSGSAVDPRILASYNPDAVANAAKYLGGTLPGTQLLDRGKEFGMAAAFAPGAALQEGQYALTKALNDAKVTNADAAKVSASTSKLFGYVADAYGNPILGKNGKPVKLPGAQLTPYQKAQLELAGARVDQSANNAAATDARYWAGLKFRSQQQAATAQKNDDKIDWTTTKNLNDGMIHLKGGGVLMDGHRRVVKWSPAQVAKSPAAKGKVSNSDYGKAVGEAKRLVGLSTNPNFGKEVTWAGPDGSYVDAKGNRYMVQQGKYLADPKYKTKVFGNGTGKPLTTNNPKYALKEQKMNLPQAITYLMNRYGLTKKQARAAMIAGGGK
jgi:hypothetical protein